MNDTPSTVHSGLRHLLGRRRFLALGGGAATLAVGGASAAKALISASGTNATPRSAQPLGNDPVAGREPTSVNPPVGGVRYYALAGTDGWYSLPSARHAPNGPTEAATIEAPLARARCVVDARASRAAEGVRPAATKPGTLAWYDDVITTSALAAWAPRGLTSVAQTQASGNLTCAGYNASLPDPGIVPLTPPSPASCAAPAPRSADSRTTHRRP